MMDSSRAGTTQAFAFTGTTTTAPTAFGAQTRQVRLVANSACCYNIGDGTPSATTASPFLPANWYEYVTVTPGQKIAAVTAATGGLVTSTNGTLWVTEMT